MLVQHRITTCSAQAIVGSLGACLLALCAAPGLHAGDWPQILGPDRNGVARDEQLAEHWPAARLEAAWERPIGRGYAGAAIMKERVVIFYREGDEEMVEALELANGKSLWKTPFKTRFKGEIFPDEDGPNCTPIVHGEQVFAFGAGGDLHALRLSDGKAQWSRALYDEYRNRAGTIDYGYFGAGSSPIVVGDRILVNAGGKGAGIVALALSDGHTLWKATDEGPSYSSPVVTTLGGRPCMVFVARLNCLGVDPTDGAVRFRFPFGQRGPTVNAASPVLVGNTLFVSSSYGVGAVASRLSPSGAKEIWASDESLSAHYNTSLHVDGHLYGVHGRTDTDTPSLRCVELATGKVIWSETDFGGASLLLADHKMLAMKVSGELLLLAPTPHRYRKMAETKILAKPVRALPALSNGRLVVRDQGTLRCVKLP